MVNIVLRYHVVDASVVVVMWMSLPRPHDRSQHGCTVGVSQGPTRVMPHPGRMMGTSERQLVRALLVLLRHVVSSLAVTSILSPLVFTPNRPENMSPHPSLHASQAQATGDLADSYQRCCAPTCRDDLPQLLRSSHRLLDTQLLLHRSPLRGRCLVLSSSLLYAVL